MHISNLLKNETQIQAFIAKKQKKRKKRNKQLLRNFVCF